MDIIKYIEGMATPTLHPVYVSKYKKSAILQDFFTGSCAVLCEKFSTAERK